MVYVPIMYLDVYYKNPNLILIPDAPKLHLHSTFEKIIIRIHFVVVFVNLSS